jgi:hypothetical protein
VRIGEFGGTIIACADGADVSSAVVGERRIRGLREQREGVGDIGVQIDAARIQRFEQTVRELVPAHVIAERIQALFEFAGALEQNQQGRRTLIADRYRFARKRRVDA